MEFPTVESRAGRICLIYTMDAGGVYPIHGAYLAGKSVWIPVVWTADGYCFESKAESDLDIAPSLGSQNGG